MKQFILYFILPLTLNSCATLFNGKKTRVNISSDSNSKLIYKKDTLVISKDKISISPKRSKQPLEFTIVKDSLIQHFSFKRKTSFLFWINAIPTFYGAGLLVDLTNKKRFTYRHNLDFTTDTISNKIVLNNKKLGSIPKNTFYIYTSPIQSIDFFSTPMLTLGTEYFFKNNLSLSLEYGNQLNSNSPNDYNIEYLKNRGALYRIETKWYNGINWTRNVHLNEYLGFELRVIKSQFNDYINYSERDSPMEEYINITDDYATKKNVTILNLKYGIFVPIGKKLYIDCYSGFGLRVKKFDYLNLEYNKNIHRIEFSDNFIFPDLNRFNDFDKRTFFNYSLGCKFGVRF